MKYIFLFFALFFSFNSFAQEQEQQKKPVKSEQKAEEPKALSVYICDSKKS